MAGHKKKSYLQLQMIQLKMLQSLHQVTVGNSLDTDRGASCTWFLNDGVAGVGYLLSLGFIWVLVLDEKTKRSTQY